MIFTDVVSFVLNSFIGLNVNWDGCINTNYILLTTLGPIFVNFFSIGFVIGITVFAKRIDVLSLVLGEVTNNRDESILHVIFNRDRRKGSVVA